MVDAISGAALMRIAWPPPGAIAVLSFDAEVTVTDIGNKFMILHSETDRAPIADSAHIDYLFQG